MDGTIRCSANYVPLTPLSFLERAAVVYEDQTSIIYGANKFTWRQTRDRCLRLASGLDQLGITRGDMVLVLAANIPATYELHFGAPMVGAVISPLNTKYDSSMLSLVLEQTEAKILFVDQQRLELAQSTLNNMSGSNSKHPLLVLISDPQSSESPPPSPTLDYETLVNNADPHFDIRWPIDECDPISISFTSGTTGRPKGVVYSHRGSYLNSIASVLANEIRVTSVYLWTVPMFHCNGWCMAWSMAAQGGTSICLSDDVTPEIIFDNIIQHGVTHMGGAPSVLNMITKSSVAKTSKLAPGQKVRVFTGGASPPPQVLIDIEDMGFEITHAYGMTETFGPGTICTWKPEWDSLPIDEKAKLKTRQGVQHLMMDKVDVKDPMTMESVPSDGKTVGEVMFRGNTIMSGYFKDLEKTNAVFGSGWFRTGDLAVKHSDGYVQLKDRSSDVINCGGRSVSTIEVEAVLFSYPAVVEAAVVGKDDDILGEKVCAIVHLKEEGSASAEEIIEFCHERLDEYKVPSVVVFGKIPKTSTGKTQKLILTDMVNSMKE